mgnify:CR=1 FL=1
MKQIRRAAVDGAIAGLIAVADPIRPTSAEAVRQLKAIGDWRDTLPLPVPADRIDWREAPIGGAQGLLLGERSGLGSAAIWQRDGRIYGVAGVLRQAQVLRVAESLG